jgi:hypothetical protein
MQYKSEKPKLLPKPIKATKIPLGRKNTSPVTGKRLTLSEVDCRKRIQRTCMHLKDLNSKEGASYKTHMGYVTPSKKCDDKPVKKDIPLHMIDLKAYLKHCRENNIE